MQSLSIKFSHAILLVFMIMESSLFAGKDQEDLFIPLKDPDFDWIQLTSGEWLKGDFKVMYDYVVEFDSEELDLQEFDLEDVKQLRTRDEQVIRFESDGWDIIEDHTKRGRLILEDDKILLIDGEEEHEYQRSEVIAIAAGVERERDFWSGSISIGINARGGNAETVDTTAMLDIKRRRASSRFLADYIGNFSQAGGDETANNQRVSATYDWFLTSRFFWRTLGLQYFRDPFSNIDNQYLAGTAIGYDLVRNKKVEWDASMGVGYQRQDFVSVAAPDDPTVDTAIFMASTALDWEVTGSVDFLADYNLHILDERSGTYTHHALVKVSTEFIGDLDFDVSLIWDYIHKPQVKEDGTLPKSSDYQLVFSLAYDF